MDHVAAQVKKDPILIKERHFLKEGDVCIILYHLCDLIKGL